jgi:hypothetical protein
MKKRLTALILTMVLLFTGCGGSAHADNTTLTFKKDGETKLDTVPKDTGFLHFRFILEGGKPQETVDLIYKIIWPAGVQKDGKGF